VPSKIIRIPEARHRRVGHDLSLSFGGLANRLIKEQAPVLVADKKAGAMALTANLRAVFLFHMDGQPLGKVAYPGFGSRIGRTRVNGAMNSSMRCYDNAAFLTGHHFAKNLAGQNRAHQIQVQHPAYSLRRAGQRSTVPARW